MIKLLRNASMCRFHPFQGVIDLLGGEDTLIIAKQQNSERPANMKAHCPCDPPSGIFLHEQNIRLVIVGIYDGFTLAQVEARGAAKDIHRFALPNGNYLHERAGTD